MLRRDVILGFLAAPFSFLDGLKNKESTVVGLSGRNDYKMGCKLSGPGRGDCENFVGLPGKSIPGQHDGPDDTVDVYGIPNGWCDYCWQPYSVIRHLNRQSLAGGLESIEWGEIKPGDKVVVRVDRILEARQQKQLKAHVQKWAGADVDVLVVPREVEIEVGEASEWISDDWISGRTRFQAGWRNDD